MPPADKTGHNEDTGADRDETPQILTPVTAEDYASAQNRRKRVIWITVIVLLAGVGYLYKRYTDPLRARESYDAAERLYKVARYTQAILSLDSAVGYKSDYPDAYFLRGQAHMATGDVEAAVPDFTRVIAMQPTRSLAYLERGIAYLGLKNYTAAMQDAGKAIELDPKMAAGYNLKGSVTRALGKPADALADFDHAVQLEQNLDNYFQRGATYQLIGRHKEAVADFDQAIRYNPQSAQAYFARADSKRELGDLKGAKDDHLQGRVLDGR